MPATTEVARYVIDHGFFGMMLTERSIDHGADAPAETTQGEEVCFFFADYEDPGDAVLGMASQGGVFDFALSIDVPEGFGNERRAAQSGVGMVIDRTGEVMGISRPVGATNEVWLATEEANSYLDTLKVYKAQSGEEVRPDLVGK